MKLLVMGLKEKGWAKWRQLILLLKCWVSYFQNEESSKGSYQVREMVSTDRMTSMVVVRWIVLRTIYDKRVREAIISANILRDPERKAWTGAVVFQFLKDSSSRIIQKAKSNHVWWERVEVEGIKQECPPVILVTRALGRW